MQGQLGPCFCAVFPTSNYWRRVLSHCAHDCLLEMFTTHAWPAVCHIPSSLSPTLAPTSLLLYHALIFSLFLPLPWGALIISWVLKRNSDQFPAFSGKETGLERGSNWSKINTASFIYSLNQEHSLPFKIWLKCHLTRDIWLHLKQISLIILLCYYPLCVFTLYHNL